MNASRFIQVVIDGNLNEMLRSGSSTSSRSSTAPRSLAQKQGSRKGGRTRERRQYVESGYLYHFYYRQEPHDQ